MRETALVALAATVAGVVFCGRAAQPASTPPRTVPPPAVPAAPREKVVGGPYVVNVGPRSATVMWIVQTGQASLGGAPGKKDKTEPILRPERAFFTGLQPGHKYYYQSFAGAAGKGSFQTPPAGASQFQFVVYGDTRTRHDVHRRVISAILKYANPDFVVHTGDLVENGDDASLWPIFFSAERLLLRKAAFYPVIGNHDRNAKYYYDFLDAKPYYSFNWGSAHFTVIDSDIANAAPTKAERDAFWAEQTRWLEADLQAGQKADFRFLFAHHPPMTAVKSRQGDNPHMTALEPMFEKYKLTAGFFGHDHNYQHYLLNGVHYFITGGGGAPLYDVDLPPPGITRKVESIENFVVVKVDGAKARFEALKPNGETLDVTELGP
jgi:predicted phosphodiesterase